LQSDFDAQYAAFRQWNAEAFEYGAHSGRERVRQVGIEPRTAETLIDGRLDADCA
jgi:hypothetical protein